MTKADSVRAGVPLRSMADSSARQFIMVASMPMVSPVGRDTPREETSTPRTILPPPTTSATSAPSFCAAITSPAIRSTVGWSIPKPFEPARYSPESFTTTRPSTPPTTPYPLLSRARAAAPGAVQGQESAGRRLLLAAGCRDFGREIGFLLLDSLAESIVHKARDFHRCTDLTLSFLHRLGHGLAAVVDKSLL